MKRIMIFTGKGGVGKTSIAAAHARKSALEGKKTLLVSTDMAHNLGDIFEQKIGRNGVEITKHFKVLELDPSYILEHEFPDLKNAIQNLILSSAVGNLKIQSFTIPGIEELISLLKICEIYEKEDYERIIVDCAPTGETLSLLKLPELMSWYMEKFFPVGKVAVRILAPVSRKFFKIELPDKNAMTDIEKIYLKLIQLQELLKNREVTSVRFVTLPEKMVVEETKRNYMYMNLYGYLVDGIYINRILPQEAESVFFQEWFEIQKYYIEELEDTFSSVLIKKIPWYETDVCGLASIDRICNEILIESDLFFIRAKLENEQYEKTEQGYVLNLFLPNVEKNEINLHQSGSDVIIKIGNFKRNIPIPNTLRHYEISSAKLENSILKMEFRKENKN